MLLNGEHMLRKGLQCKLQVVKMKHWKRDMNYMQTGLQWVPSSPHIPQALTAFFYPMSGILGELGYMNIGVGYTIPFQAFAAAWVNGEELAKAMNALNVPGVSFRPISYKPFYNFSKGVQVEGVQVHILNYEEAPLTDIQFLIMQEIARLYPSKAVFMFDKVCGSKEIRKRLSLNYRWSDVKDYWYKDVESFKKISRKYHLYKNDFWPFKNRNLE